jgi:hypothetical protein
MVIRAAKKKIACMLSAILEDWGHEMHSPTSLFRFMID